MIPPSLNPRTSVNGRGWFRPTLPNFFFSLSLLILVSESSLLIQDYTISDLVGLSLVDARQSKNHQKHGLSHRRVYIPPPPPATMQSIPDEIKQMSEANRIWVEWGFNRYVPLAHLEKSYYDFVYVADDLPDQEEILEMMYNDMIEEFNLTLDEVEAYWYYAEVPTWDDWDTAALDYWGYY